MKNQARFPGAIPEILILSLPEEEFQQHANWSSSFDVAQEEDWWDQNEARYGGC